MKKILFILVIGFSLNAWSSKGRRVERPGGKTGVRRGEIFRDFNNRISTVLSHRVSLRTPERLTPDRSNHFATQAENLVRAIEVEARKPSFENKRQDIVSILDTMNMGFATRSNLLEFIEKNKNSKDDDTQSVVSEAKSLVSIIDNSFNILKSRVNDSIENPVDGQKITQMLAVFGRVNGEFTSQMVRNLVLEIRSIIDNPSITLRRIALCR